MKERVVSWAVSVTWEDERGTLREELVADVPKHVANEIDDWLTEEELNKSGENE